MISNGLAKMEEKSVRHRRKAWSWVIFVLWFFAVRLLALEIKLGMGRAALECTRASGMHDGYHGTIYRTTHVVFHARVRMVRPSN